MKKSFFITIVMFWLANQSTQAQQDPQYTQYMYNQAVINPAYAGSTQSLSLVALYRDQWTGFDGAPKTITFSGHGPVGKKVGLGLSVISDQHGPIKEHNIYADFSYTLEVGGGKKLAFGAKSGATIHNRNLASSVVTLDPGDPFFSTDINEVTPNVGLGAFFYADKYYLGLSLPNLLKSVHLSKDGLNIGSEEQHFFVSAGYVFTVSDNVKLKPSTLVKSAFSSPLSFDLNLNALFFDKFELGASYRNEDAISGLINFAFTPKLRIGYAYDHIISNINLAAKSSHEVILLFDLNFPAKVSRSPRFF